MNQDTERLSEQVSESEIPTPQSRFLALARKLAAVPKSELDAELTAVKNGKPLKPLPKPAQ